MYQAGTLAWVVTVSPSSPIVRYLNAASDLLTSVKKTEDSLSKLKRSRRSTVPAASPADGVTDDNKIRLQIALDVATYAEQVRADGVVARQCCMCAGMKVIGHAGVDSRMIILDDQARQQMTCHSNCHFSATQSDN